MATYPALAPAEDHILSSTTEVQQADYKGNFKKFIYLNFDKVDTSKVRVFYRTFGDQGTETIRMKAKPSGLLLNDNPIKEIAKNEGYTWSALANGGVLTVRRKTGNRIIIVE
jgi:hypothetical protein